MLALALVWLPCAAYYFSKKKDGGKTRDPKGHLCTPRAGGRQPIYLVLLGFGIEDGDQKIAVGILVLV
jgi:hypothetical protein